jgi:hypothetical protein
MNRTVAQDIVQSPEMIARTKSGRLATVEPARRRITLVPIGEARMVELELADRVEVVHAEQLGDR